jgi:hypothetical protein
VTRNRFSFPVDDCLHVLAEYDTSSIEETKIAAFQPGTTKTGAMYGLLFLLAQLHLDVAIAPVTKVEIDVIDPEPWIHHRRQREEVHAILLAYQPGDRDAHRGRRDLAVG